MKTGENTVCVTLQVNGIFFRHPRATISVVSGWILPKLELIQVQVVMHFLAICKFKKYRINIGDIYFTLSRAANTVVSDLIWQNFELIQAFMHVLGTCNQARIMDQPFSLS